MIATNSPDSSAVEIFMLQQIRNAIRGHDLIDWAIDDFESFLSLFNIIHLQDGSVSRMKDGAIYLNTLPDMVRMHAKCRTSHVLITHLNENWGEFSTTVPNRTVDWGDWYSNMIDAGCTLQMVQQYLDDPKVQAVVTTQHVAFRHPSILSIPIGINHPQEIINHLFHADGAKTKELLLNNSGWGHRQGINERVIANFSGRISNTYGIHQSEYYESVTRSRFVLCPSGMGWDTYRIWETLLLGAIPIVEYSAGWDVVLDDLPVLFVTNFDEVTPELLAAAYPAILSRCQTFDYDKLTKQWWVSRITELVAWTRPSIKIEPHRRIV